jgi:thiamine biosynthesis lipoprotein
VSSATFAALGTTAVVATTDDTSLRAARRAVEREVTAIDAACSRFRSDSELARVNRSPGRWVQIGEVLCEALAAALAAAAETDGLVDPTVGRSLLALGYATDFWSSPPDSDLAFNSAPAGRWREIELDPARTRVRIPLAGSLDLGATAKALAADRASAAAAREAGGALVSLGGDISISGPAPREGWSVRVTDDHRSPVDVSGQTVAITRGGLATSSTTVRTWRRGDRTVHHIVDPVTGAPPPPVWRTVSVAAATCVDANVASTACIVQGESALDWLDRRSLPARLVRPSGAVVTTCGWPADHTAAGAG